MSATYEHTRFVDLLQGLIKESSRHIVEHESDDPIVPIKWARASRNLMFALDILSPDTVNDMLASMDDEGRAVWCKWLGRVTETTPSTNPPIRMYLKKPKKPKEKP
jgi:hypothetical protein